MIGKIGEVIDIIKKNGNERAGQESELRGHLIEELADVLMYFNIKFAYKRFLYNLVSNG